jgi:hypothetical protein
MMDGIFTTSTCTRFPDTPITVEAILEAAREIPKPEYDCVVMAEADWERVKCYFTIDPAAHGLASMSLHVKPTREHAVVLAGELAAQGKRPLLYPPL